MNVVGRWVVIVIAVLVVVGLLAYARGNEHHRGDEVGALGASAPVSATSPG
jgi:hypothetical protein